MSSLSVHGLLTAWAVVNSGSVDSAAMDTSMPVPVCAQLFWVYI